MHRTYRVASFGSALNRKILSPHSTGELWPIPGSSAFQFRSFSVHDAGIVVVSLSPCPLGPRKRVHSCAAAIAFKAVTNSAAQPARANVIRAFRRMGETSTGRVILGGIDRTC